MGTTTQVTPLSVEAREFSPRTESKSRVVNRVRLDEGIDDLLSRTGPKKIVKRRDAVGLNTAVDGAATLAEIAGAAVPADLAGTNIPAVAGMRLLAVAEVHSSAVDIEGDPSIIRTDIQRSAAILDALLAPRKDGGLREEISVLEPLEHSVMGLSREGGNDSVEVMDMLHPLEHSGADRLADPIGGPSVLGPLEHSVPEVPLSTGAS